ncbi:hypothetical protein A3A63_01205 [Candidatus Gottesmanbacteria bacterium RIFCSPLOWO2_01_FULL_46_9]|uniref:Uncharacterized protein n=1 Tax=Candidatus Gottesmanbacteria bacterium RIFCSPLOWO2_01_FULL_46_9 TaxID=1798394 RepID=A0A1F6B2Y3_9BACT|nr:MAG: hypothetical protein A3A63_01205 [Candidatus Gottesmanbacteria bacterium RIFCSPLOWO2_01_FULL_46_9]
MTQLSRNPVHKDVYYSIRDDFIWVIGSLHSQEETKAFFYDFFTKTERVMFTKRLAIALMLHKGYEYGQIQYILHVSTSTISRVMNWLDSGGAGVKHVLDKLIREEKMEDFWTKVNHALDTVARLRK